MKFALGVLILSGFLLTAPAGAQSRGGARGMGGRPGMGFGRMGHGGFGQMGRGGFGRGGRSGFGFGGFSRFGRGDGSFRRQSFFRRPFSDRRFPDHRFFDHRFFRDRFFRHRFFDDGFFGDGLFGDGFFGVPLVLFDFPGFGYSPVGVNVFGDYPPVGNVYVEREVIVAPREEARERERRREPDVEKKEPGGDKDDPPGEHRPSQRRPRDDFYLAHLVSDSRQARTR